ncbi:MAG: hypothetical protein ACOC95_02040 [Planctomycetota bacterium]
MRWTWLIFLALPLLAGCPVVQPQDTPVDQRLAQSAVGDEAHWLYVPSTYRPSRPVPLVITLHGTYGFDSASAQIREWKALAERHGFIVAAPPLQSVQGILPRIPSLWYSDLARDEETILNLLQDVTRDYRIARDGSTGKRLVLLTGFSAGGYPMYYTGLRNPSLFHALVARAANCDDGIFERVEVIPELRQLHVIIYYGRADLLIIPSQSRAAFGWLREHGVTNAELHQVSGGHWRHPEYAWDFWCDHLPARFRPEASDSNP